MDHMETDISFFDYPIHDEKKLGFHLFGERQEVRESEEPTNIAWEYMGISTSWRNFMKLIAVLFSIIFISLIMFGIITIKYKAYEI